MLKNEVPLSVDDIKLTEKHMSNSMKKSVRLNRMPLMAGSIFAVILTVGGMLITISVKASLLAHCLGLIFVVGSSFFLGAVYEMQTKNIGAEKTNNHSLSPSEILNWLLRLAVLGAFIWVSHWFYKQHTYATPEQIKEVVLRYPAIREDVEGRRNPITWGDLMMYVEVHELSAEEDRVLLDQQSVFKR
jgi:hypothetical protein